MKKLNTTNNKSRPLETGVFTGLAIAGINYFFEPDNDLQQIINPAVPLVMGFIIWAGTYAALYFGFKSTEDLRIAKQKQDDLQAQKDFEENCDKKIKQCDDFLKKDLSPDQEKKYRALRGKYMDMKLRGVTAQPSKNSY
jgi:hypothetical protein